MTAHHAHELLAQWLIQRQIQQQSIHTLDAYRRDISDFIHFFQQRNLNLTDLEHSDVRAYLSEQVEQNLSSNTIQRRLSAIRQFMQWLKQSQHLNINPLDNFQLKRQPRALPGMMDIECIQQILEQDVPKTYKKKQLWCRDKAILEFFYSSGLRLSELQQLKIKDLDFDRQTVRIRGKGNKTRLVPFGSKAKESLIQWLEIAQTWHTEFNSEQAVFIGQTGQALGVRQIENRVKYQAKRAGVSIDVHPHLLRHCFASHLLSNSGDLRAVQEMLGHQSLTTTQIYTHVDFDQLAQVYDQAHPRANRKKD